MPNKLHIVNGDAFGDKLRASDIDGDILVWRESLYEGPIGMQMSDSVLLSMRAAYMNRQHGIPEGMFKSITLQQEKALDKLAEDVDEVVLWFEHDLYDQLILCYLLSRLFALPNRSFKLSLLSINQFPGVEFFHGLGQLNEDQITQLNHKWLPVNEDQLLLACKVWTAYSASEPLLMETLLEEDLSALPFLKKALEANSERYPSSQNGLSANQQLILELIGEEEMPILSLFKSVGQTASHYGLGDLQFWAIVDSIRKCEVPLVHLIGGDKLPSYSEALPPQFEKWRLHRTDMGKLVHTCELDHLYLNGIDDWIGGVHLLGKKDIWRRKGISTGFEKM
ncbi:MULTISPECIES: DUF1835 domain-containing protein [unclassified Paenibacillus]|uniref:DUF1835 domain-containing protein n=1 Tax=unclassified Paenibacillus TaxID=185978 RepID=UPI00070C57DC|nr:MULTISPECIES: DUF1835 domain-containing protein [unclassified Paenibacillus]KQX63783.1 hypothetical protein ASD40_29015 [Paenibacillus sp. Root444D2]KRE45219.1 hypothetical protein ASG85_31835 [Paenibacillus sp. Soil724D2]